MLFKKGFTITEIMIALGVLVTGMAMVAGALHAGIQNHVRTVDNVMWDIVGENGLSTIRARMRHTINLSNSIGSTPAIIADTLTTDTIQFKGLGPQDRRNPAFGGTWTNGTFFGYCVIGWRPTSTCTGTDFKNDYRFCILPYRIVPGITGTINYKTFYGEIATTNNIRLTNLTQTTGIVTQISLNSRTEALNFSKGAVTIFLLGTLGKVATGTVAAVPVGTVVTLDRQLKDENDVGITGAQNIVTITVKNPVGQPDTTGAGIDLMKPYQMRTSLTPSL